MRISLSSPLTVAGRTLHAIELRPPGRRVFEVLRLERGPLRFSEAAVVRFAARLSEHSESTIRRLSAEDLAAVAQGVEQTYAHARRRFGVRSALAEAARAQRGATE